MFTRVLLLLISKKKSPTAIHLLLKLCRRQACKHRVDICFRGLQDSISTFSTDRLWSCPFSFGDIFNHFVKNNKQLSTLVFSFSRFWSSPECFSWNMSEILLSRALHQRQAKLCWRETLPHSYYWEIVLWLSGSEAFRVVTHQNDLLGFGDPPPLVCVPETFWDYCNLTHGRLIRLWL